MAPNTPFLAQRTKATLVLVCHLWHQIATPILYEHIVILSPSRAAIILHALESHISTSPVGRVSEYGLFVRNLEIFTHARNAHSISYLQTLYQIFILCPRLRILCGNWSHSLPPDFVRGITRLYGSSLQELYWKDTKDQSFINPVHLSSFHTIRVLDLRNYSGGDVTPAYDMSTLPLLEHLVLASSHASMSAALSLALPSLNTLTLKPCDAGYFASQDIFRRFLKLHGPSLLSVHLPSSAGLDPEPIVRPLHGSSLENNVKPETFLLPDACPNLHTLTFTIQSPVITIDTPHQGLRRIGVCEVASNGLYPDKASPTKSHLMAIRREVFPNLETVRTVGFLVDADSDMLAEDVFIWWTEYFEQEGIDFQDGAGSCGCMSKRTDAILSSTKTIIQHFIYLSIIYYNDECTWVVALQSGR
ncbi:hypothetical protein BDZ89DRAFT_1121625 [Hymenopellis radicata]|nr:hypothetical protein BDZ89DRAFT_1121625 [Hymenopellis radicata]